MGVAATHGGGALSAGARHCKRNARRGYGVDKRRLSGGCETDGQTEGGNTDRISFPAADIQTDAMKGLPPGNNPLTLYFIFEKTHLCKHSLTGKKQEAS